MGEARKSGSVGAKLLDNIVRVKCEPLERIKPKKPNYNCKFNTGEFIAWDGEGVTINRKHHYILLACSTGDYIQSPDDQKCRGLTTIECLDFLLSVAEQHPRTYHVIYGGNYDANKILKDLIYSPHRLRKLWENNQCFYEHYFIEWIPGKWLAVKCMKTKRRIVLYDVISFFQSSFVNALSKWDIHIPHLENVEEMKKKRGQFKWSERTKIRRYCFQELDGLKLLMNRFRESHIKAGLPSLTGFYGPGAVANGLLKQHNIQSFMLATDGELNLASRYAYAAGRIERLLYGNYEGPITIYDINSAYPYSISRLPNLSSGWRLAKRLKRDYSTPMDIVPMSLYHVRLYHHGSYASPLFYRKGLAKARPIYFPNPKDYIETWIWTPEYEVLCNGSFPFETIGAYLFKGTFEDKPFAWLEDLYNIRRERKSQNDPSEKNLKLAYNSIYGKFVQQAGWKRDRKLPKWHQLEWGGYVTSETRAKLFSCISSLHKSNIGSVVGCETDSVIVAGSDRPKLQFGDGLGEWSETSYEGITYVQSGVYWLKKEGEWLDLYSKRRGYLPGTLTREAVIKAWNSNPYGDSTIQNNGNAVGMVVDARGKTFITLGHCFRPGQTFDKWGDWEEGPKKLSLWRINKRDIDRTSNPAMGLLTTTDRTSFSGWSSPYELEWQKEREDAQ